MFHQWTGIFSSCNRADPKGSCFSSRTQAIQRTIDNQKTTKLIFCIQLVRLRKRTIEDKNIEIEQSMVVKTKDELQQEIDVLSHFSIVGIASKTRKLFRKEVVEAARRIFLRTCRRLPELEEQDERMSLIFYALSTASTASTPARASNGYG